MAHLPPVPSVPASPEQLGNLLTLALRPDNASLQQTLPVIKAFMRTAACVMPLMQQLCDAPSSNVRQLAGILLRRRIRTLWKHLDPKMHSQVQDALLKRLIEDPDRAARRAVAALMACVAQVTVPDGTWPQLPTALANLSQAGDAGHREIALLLFRALAERIGQHLRAQFDELARLFVSCLGDADRNVRYQAVKAIESLAEWLTDEQDANRILGTVPLLTQIGTVSVQQGDIETAAGVVAVFDAVVDRSWNLPQVQQSEAMLSLLQFCVHLAPQVSVDVSVRAQAIDLLTTFTRRSGRRVVAMQLLEPFLATSIQLTTEPYDDDQHAAGATTAMGSGVEFLDAIVSEVPKGYFLSHVMQHISRLAQNAQDANARRGGFNVLTVVMPEANLELKDQAQQFMAMACQGVGDADFTVRATAAVCLTQAVDTFPEAYKHCYPQVLPLVINALGQAGMPEGCYRKLITALDICVGNLPEGVIGTHLNVVMNVLAAFFPRGANAQAYSVRLQARAVSAIKSTAEAAKMAFMPFFPATFELCVRLMSLEAQEVLPLRAAATECLGAVALAVGPGTFGVKQLEQCIGVVLAGMKLDYFSVRTAAYSFFTKLVEAMKGEFVSVLPTVMTVIFASLFSDDGVVFQIKEGALDDGPSAFDFESDEEGEAAAASGQPEAHEHEEGVECKMHPDAHRATFSIQTGAMDEKAAALETLAQIVSEVKKPFLPYLEKTLEAMYQLDEYPNDRIRHNVVGVWDAVVDLMTELSGQGLSPKSPIRDGRVVPLDADVKTVLSKFVPALTANALEEEDAETALYSVEVLNKVLVTFGVSAVENLMTELTRTISFLLQERGCSQRLGPNRVGEDENGAGHFEAHVEKGGLLEHDEVLIDGVATLAYDAAKTLGPSYATAVMGHFLPPLLAFAEPHRPVRDKVMGVGYAAALLETFPNRIPPVVQELVPRLQVWLSDDYAEVRRNGAYMCGVLVLHGGPALAPVYGDFLARLTNIFRQPLPQAFKDEEDRSAWLSARDNVAAATAKMISNVVGISPPSSLLQPIPPPAGFDLQAAVNMLVSGVPLVDDLEERKHVYWVLLGLLERAPQLVAAHLGKIAQAVALVLVSGDCAEARSKEECDLKPEDDQHIKEVCARAAAALLRVNESAVQQALAGLPPVQQSQFAEAARAAVANASSGSPR